MSEVLTRVAGVCGRITLNRPAAINALTLEMVLSVEAALVAWAADASVQFVLLDGAGERGLCAGGDIRAMHAATVAGDFALTRTFFAAEYRLNYLIARYPKPYVVLMDRLVMGGGVGISAHGSHRIMTERAELAMPETGIGFFPDVGVNYLFGRAPEHMGAYLALTGRRVHAADALRCGLADFCVSSTLLAELTVAVEQCGSIEEVEHTLKSYNVVAPDGMAVEQREWIGRCFAHASVEGTLENLRAETTPEAGIVCGELETKSPLSLKISLLALRRATAMGDLAGCLQQDFYLAQSMTREHDFVEGVRAAVIDKDRNPKWSPASLAEITAEMLSRVMPERFEKALDLSYAGIF